MGPVGPLGPLGPWGPWGSLGRLGPWGPCFMGPWAHWAHGAHGPMGPMGCDPPVELDWQTTDFICHSDGGMRGESCSAAAWYLEAVVTENGASSTFPLAMRGQFLKDPVSSFLAEAIALEDGMAYLSQLLSNNTGNSAKRARVAE